ncbi:hypothetical protein WA026_021329 [Henosepilachna vigintioctopunctata]|uniref:Uncharacterized protein n=1 Tax=Henosepilachna vigintioctopunctata TaxID=420089 RepID=A0AAW1U5S2_9CUCU
MRRLLHRRYDPVLKLETEVLTDEINQTINSIKTKAWEETFRQTGHNTNKMGEIAKNLKKNNETFSIPPIQSSDGIETTDQEKAEAIAETFEKTHRLTENHSDYRTEKHVHKQTKRILKEKHTELTNT